MEEFIILLTKNSDIIFLMSEFIFEVYNSALFKYFYSNKIVKYFNLNL